MNLTVANPYIPLTIPFQGNNSLLNFSAISSQIQQTESVQENETQAPFTMHDLGSIALAALVTELALGIFRLLARGETVGEYLAARNPLLLRVGRVLSLSFAFVGLNIILSLVTKNFNRLYRST